MVGSSKHTIFIADTRRSGVPLHSRHRRMDSWKLPGGINGSGNSRKKYFNILATSMALNELSIEMPDSIFSWKQKIENIKKKIQKSTDARSQWFFLLVNIFQLTRISFCRAAEPALRNSPSTSTFSIISVQASDTNFGTRHTLPLDNFTSVNSKLFNGTLNTLCCPTSWN